MRLAVRVKVSRDEVVVAVLGDAVDEGGEVLRVAEAALCIECQSRDVEGEDGEPGKTYALDQVKDLLERRVELEVAAVGVLVAKVLDVLAERAEEEDVLLANLARDFNL